MPITKIDGTSSSRRVISGIALRPGDEIRIEGTTDGGETAAIDYVEVLPDEDGQGKLIEDYKSQ